MALLLGGCYAGVEGFDPNAGGAGDAGEDDEEQDEADELCGAAKTGPTALRRLTQSQYRRTVRDLLGIDTTVAEGFAPDERVGAFKSNAVAPVVDLQVEQYMDAAEAVATEATADVAALLPCDPAAIGEDACAEQWLRELAPRAYRRALVDADITRLMEVYSTARAEGTFEDGIRVALQGVLQSPWFLYHVELGDLEAEVTAGEPTPLSGHELASRLSYFLWDTMPDQALFDAAAAGELDTDEGIEAQVERMLADPKAQEAVALFHTQWLAVDELETLEKSSTVYPDFDPALAQAMKEDTESFTNWVIFEGDARLETLLTGAFTLSEDPALLALYGVSLPAGHVSGERIPLPAGERAGLLTQPAVMARHAHADQTSPVHRGKLVRENFLCQPLPAPPPDVDNVPPDPDPNSTTRERFEEHEENPACAPCHKLIDGLGFGFENYDAVGAFRSMEGDLPVDASGEVVNTEDINGAFDGAVELAGKLAVASETADCMAKQWFRFSLGRMDTDLDSCTMESLSTAFEESDQDVHSLIRQIVLSHAFRYRLAPEGE
ncbi:MAG: DUF1592 domain-containing protein [Myxococcales bacterium]|nr:DUF1592 domain-containing protein [Myxococcales bacterium]